MEDLLILILKTALKMNDENAHDTFNALKHGAQTVHDGLKAADKNEEAAKLVTLAVNFLGMAETDFA
jgi:hypothetical protein